MRFTNGYPYGYNESGGSGTVAPFPTGQGVPSPPTVTYLGNLGRRGGDGADGISFFLMDASKLNTSIIPPQAVPPPATATDSFLRRQPGYSCSNSNNPYNGLNGGYLGSHRRVR